MPERIDVRRRRFAGGLAGACRVPACLVHTVSANAKQAGPELLEKAEKIDVASGEKRLGQLELFVTQPHKTRRYRSQFGARNVDRYGRKRTGGHGLRVDRR